MKLLFFVSVLLTCFSFKPYKSDSLNPALNGTWAPIKLEINGNELPSAAFEKQKLIINDTNYTFIAESVDKGVVKIGKEKLDIYGKDGVNEGKHFTAIYKLVDGLLTICYNLAGDVYPEAFETKSKPTLFMAVFKKIE